MKGRRFAALARKYLLPHLPGYAASGGVVFVEPIGLVLRGFCCDSSAFSADRFYVWAFVQPLFVPEDGIVLSLGERLGTLGGGAECWWTLDESNEVEVMNDVATRMVKEGLPFLEKFKTLELFVKNTIKRYPGRQGPYPPEMLAFAAILLGNRKLANKMFDRLEKVLRDPDDRRDYEEELLQRARRVREAFDRNPDEAVAILHQWREETAAHLKLTKFLENLQPATSRE